MPVPNHIRRFRTAHRLKAKDLAEAIGVSPAALSKWESRAREVSDEFKLALAEYFCVPVAALFDFGYDPLADALRRTIDSVAALQMRVEAVEGDLDDLQRSTIPRAS